MAQNIFRPGRTPVALTGTPAFANAAGLLKQVSNSLSQAADVQFKEWQEAVQRKATDEGMMAGAEGAPEYRAGESLQADAFNTAAKKSYITRLETDASARMAEYAEEFKNDPEGYLKASQKYINGISEELKQSSQTAPLADLFSARLQLDAQSTGYKIQKRYAALQQEQLRADNEALYMTIKNNTYREAGGIFSKDKAVQVNALERLTVSKKALDQSLHAVMPDGTPVYSPMEVQAREQDFYRQFYTRAAQDYIAGGDISEEELGQILDGTFSAKIEGLGEINILDNVGADRYENDVKRFAINKVREQVAAKQKEQRLLDDSMRQYRETNGLQVLGGLLSGVPMDSREIMSMVESGTLSASDAKSALKLIFDPNSGQEDYQLVSDLQVRIMQGEDVSSEIRKNAYRLHGNTFEKLMKENGKTQQGQVDDYKKWLSDQALAKDAFGFVDPNSRKQAVDIMTAYDQMIEDGMEPELAYEKSLTTLEAIQKDRLSGKFGRIPRYTVTTEGGAVDVAASFEETLKAFNEGRISEIELEAEYQKLDAIQRGE